MDPETQSGDSKPSVTSNLYRLADDVRDEIEKAVVCYQKMPVYKDKGLVMRALEDLNRKINVETSPAPVIVQAQRLPLIMEDNPLADARFANARVVVKKIFEIELQNAKGITKTTLQRVLSKLDELL